MPDNVPDVVEVGATSAPLLSASYFIGAKCKPYNDDFMLCREESQGSGAIDCLKEGRRVTRCAVSVIEDINKSCLDEFRLHWQCLEQNNHQLSGCRKAEALLNKCVFTNLNLEKKIPGLRADEEPVFLKKDPWIKPAVDDFKSVRAYAEAKKNGTL